MRHPIAFWPIASALFVRSFALLALSWFSRFAFLRSVLIMTSMCTRTGAAVSHKPVAGLGTFAGLRRTTSTRLSTCTYHFVKRVSKQKRCSGTVPSAQQISEASVEEGDGAAVDKFHGDRTDR